MNRRPPLAERPRGRLSAAPPDPPHPAQPAPFAGAPAEPADLNQHWKSPTCHGSPLWASMHNAANRSRARRRPAADTDRNARATDRNGSLCSAARMKGRDSRRRRARNGTLADRLQTRPAGGRHRRDACATAPVALEKTIPIGLYCCREKRIRRINWRPNLPRGRRRHRRRRPHG